MPFRSDSKKLSCCYFLLLLALFLERVELVNVAVTAAITNDTK